MQTCILCDNPAAYVHTTPNGMTFPACSLHRPESHTLAPDAANGGTTDFVANLLREANDRIRGLEEANRALEERIEELEYEIDNAIMDAKERDY